MAGYVPRGLQGSVCPHRVTWQGMPPQGYMARYAPTGSHGSVCPQRVAWQIYMALLPSVPVCCTPDKLHGLVGMFLRSGKLAAFRLFLNSRKQPQDAALYFWESPGLARLLGEG